jgi:hypothetical protein
MQIPSKGFVRATSSIAVLLCLFPRAIGSQTMVNLASTERRSIDVPSAEADRMRSLVNQGTDEVVRNLDAGEGPGNRWSAVANFAREEQKTFRAAVIRRLRTPALADLDVGAGDPAAYAVAQALLVRRPGYLAEELARVHSGEARRAIVRDASALLEALDDAVREVVPTVNLIASSSLRRAFAADSDVPENYAAVGALGLEVRRAPLPGLPTSLWQVASLRSPTVLARRC